MADPSSQPITLSGTNLTGPSTSGYTFERDVQLFVSIDRAPYQLIPGHWNATSMITSWSWSTLNITFSSSVMCRAPGTLDFYVRVLGVNSNLLSIPIVAAPNHSPTIQSISPTSKPVTATDWLVSISGSGFDFSSTAVSLNGVSAGFLARSDPIAGYILAYVPQALRSKAGHYQVVVKTKHGTSNPVGFDILGFPHIAAIKPATIWLVPPTPPPGRATKAIALSHPIAATSGSSTQVDRNPLGAAQETTVAPALLGFFFDVEASDLDGEVKLMFGGSPLAIESTVLTHGSQKVVARLPDWAADRCGAQAYAIQLSTEIGTSNQANLIVQGKPCPTLPSQKSSTTLATPH